MARTRKLAETKTPDGYRFAIIKDTEWGDLQVRVYDANGTYLPDRTYHGAMDRDDANETMASMVAEHNATRDQEERNASLPLFEQCRPRTLGRVASLVLRGSTVQDLCDHGTVFERETRALYDAGLTNPATLIAVLVARVRPQWLARMAENYQTVTDEELVCAGAALQEWARDRCRAMQLTKGK